MLLGVNADYPPEVHIDPLIASARTEPSGGHFRSKTCLKPKLGASAS